MKKLVFIIILMLNFISYSFAAVWTPVSTSGLGDTNNMILFPGPVKDSYFYIGTYNNTDGGQLFRTSDLITFYPISTDGFGIGYANNSINPMQFLFNNELYTTTQNGTSGLQIWKSTTGAPVTWINVGTNGLGYDYNAMFVNGSAVFNNELYIGFAAIGTTYIYKNSDGSSTWTKVTNFTSTYSIYPEGVYNGWLYVGTGGGKAKLRRYNGISWQTITTNGFGDTNNVEALPAYKGFNNYIYVGFRNYHGAQLWRSSSGDSGTWTKVLDFHTIDSNNINIDSFSIPGDNYLYFSTHNDKTGTEVWRTAGGISDFEQINIDGFGNANNTTNVGCNLSRNLFNGLLFAGTEVYVDAGATLYSTPITIPSGLGESVNAEDMHILGSTDPEYLGAFVPDANSAVTLLTLALDGVSSGTLRFRIFTLTGETIFDGEVTCDAEGHFELNIPSDIASGTYIIKVEGPNFNFTKKLAVLR